MAQIASRAVDNLKHAGRKAGRWIKAHPVASTFLFLSIGTAATEPLWGPKLVNAITKHVPIVASSAPAAAPLSKDDVKQAAATNSAEIQQKATTFQSTIQKYNVDLQQVKDYQAKLPGIAQRISAAQGSVDNIQRDVDGVQGQINAKNSQLVTERNHDSELTGFITTRWGEFWNLPGWNTDRDNTRTRISNLQNDIQSLSGRINALQSQKSGPMGELTSATNEQTAVKQNILTYQISVDTAYGMLKDLVAQLNSAGIKATLPATS